MGYLIWTYLFFIHSIVDSSLIAQQSAVYPDLSESSSDIIVLKQHPLLSVFDYSVSIYPSLFQKQSCWLIFRLPEHEVLRLTL